MYLEIHCHRQFRVSYSKVQGSRSFMPAQSQSANLDMTVNSLRPVAGPTDHVSFQSIQRLCLLTPAFLRVSTREVQFATLTILCLGVEETRVATP
jgi:hypothetical protein